ncbi:MAG: hypothetical protein ACRDZ5_09210 [Acidimicrobiales bacterium]
MADLLFTSSRLAEVYDPLDPDRTDLEVYAAIVDERDARTVHQGRAQSVEGLHVLLDRGSGVVFGGEELRGPVLELLVDV